MPLTGQIGHWPFYDQEGRGLSREAVRSSPSSLISRSELENLYPTPALSASSSLQATTSAATSVPITLADLERTVEIVTRYVNGENYRIYSPSIPQMMQGEIGRLDGQVRIIETPKENKMNEMMDALETMMRRIVREELDSKDTAVTMTNQVFGTALKAYAENNKPEFAAIVSQGSLDMPWFDEAIKSEVTDACATIAPPQGVVFTSEENFRDRVLAIRDANTPPPGYTFTTKTAFERAVADVVQNDDGIEDWFGDSFNSCMGNVSFSTTAD